MACVSAANAATSGAAAAGVAGAVPAFSESANILNASLMTARPIFGANSSANCAKFPKGNDSRTGRPMIAAQTLAAACSGSINLKFLYIFVGATMGVRTNGMLTTVK